MMESTSMPRKDSTTEVTTQQQTSTSRPEKSPVVMNEAVMDLALDCRDYYGDNELAGDVLRSKYLAPHDVHSLATRCGSSPSTR